MIDVPSRWIHKIEAIHPTSTAQGDAERYNGTAVELGKQWE